MSAPPPPEERRAWIVAIVEEWRSRMYLDRWRLHVELQDADCLDAPTCHAEIKTSVEYAEAIIHVFPKMWDDKLNDEERRYMIVHELAHPIVEALRLLVYEPLNDRMVTQKHIIETYEAATEWIAAIAWKAYGNKIPNN